MFTIYADNPIIVKQDMGISFANATAPDTSSLRGDAERFAREIESSPRVTQSITGDSLLQSALRQAKQIAGENGRRPTRAEVLAIMYTERDLGMSGYTIC